MALTQYATTTLLPDCLISGPRQRGIRVSAKSHMNVLTNKSRYSSRRSMASPSAALEGKHGHSAGTEPARYWPMVIAITVVRFKYSSQAFGARRSPIFLKELSTSPKLGSETNVFWGPPPYKLEGACQPNTVILPTWAFGGFKMT